MKAPLRVSAQRRCASPAIVVALLALLSTHVMGQASAAAPDFIVNRGTGELFIKNSTAAPLVFDGYSISSPDDELIGGAWLSVADNYDLSGDMSVDSTAEWFEISGTSFNIAEVSTLALSAVLLPDQIVSLGPIVEIMSEENLAVTSSAGIETTDALVDFRTLTADYNGDLEVDGDDYTVFFDTFGSTEDLRADGNGNGMIDAADYTVWRDSEQLAPAIADAVISQINAGAYSGVSPAAAVVQSIPEPSGFLLAVGLTAALARRSARRSACRVPTCRVRSRRAS